MSAETELFIEELMSVPQSFRGIGQTWVMRQQGGLRERNDGVTISLARASRRKFDSVISFNDTYPPGLDGVYEGDLLTVHCAVWLTGGVPDEFSYEHVPGSVIWRDDDGYVIPSGADETIEPVGATNWSYRPLVQFRVVGWDTDEDEWGAISSGQLSLRMV